MKHKELGRERKVNIAVAVVKDQSQPPLSLSFFQAAQLMINHLEVAPKL